MRWFAVLFSFRDLNSELSPRQNVVRDSRTNQPDNPGGRHPVDLCVDSAVGRLGKLIRRRNETDERASDHRPSLDRKNSVRLISKSGLVTSRTGRQVFAIGELRMTIPAICDSVTWTFDVLPLPAVLLFRNCINRLQQFFPWSARLFLRRTSDILYIQPVHLRFNIAASS